MSRKRRAVAEHESVPAPGTKRRRQFTEEDAQLARIYDSLAAEDNQTRLEGARDLALKLPPDGKPSAELVSRVLHRLVRGLCSGRKAARFGFSVALTEVLRRLYGPGCAEVEGFDSSLDGLVDLVVARTRPEGKVAGQERRDHLFGRAFGFRALLKSTAFARPDAPLECWTKVLDHLYTLACDVTWLREECGSILCEAVRLGPPDDSRSHIHELVQRLRSCGLAKTPEGVAVWLTVRSVFPDVVLPEGVWHKGDPLCSKDRKTLAKVMREGHDGSSPADGRKNIKAAAQSKLNFSWDVVMASVTSESYLSDKSDSKRRKFFAQFWIEVVDNSLFADAASPESKFRGFQLLSNALRSAPEWAVGAMFSPNVMRCLVNQRQASDRYLHDAALAPLQAIVARVKRQPDVAAVIVPRLTCLDGGIVNFELLTKSQTLKDVFANASNPALRAIISYFERLLQLPDAPEQKTADSRRFTVARILATAVRTVSKDRPGSSAPGDAEFWLRDSLLLLVKYAYFVPSAAAELEDVPKPAVSDSCRKEFRTRLAAALAHLLTTRTDEQMELPYLVVSEIRLWAKSKTLSLTLKADKAVHKALKQAHRTLESIASKGQRASERLPYIRAFKLLYSLTILQVYNEDPSAISVLGEIEMCYDSVVRSSDNDANAFEILVEVLLGFVSRPSQLFRSLATEVFSAFTSEVTSSSLKSMTIVLQKGENTAGQRDLFEVEEDGVEDGESGEGDDVDVDEMSDVEILKGEPTGRSAGLSVKGNPGSEAGSDDSDSPGEESSESGSSEVESDADDSEELAEFDAKLADVLKTSSALQGNGDDESDMDDEQMMALEPALVAAFKQRTLEANRGKKREQKDGKETIINFKNRVLDLLQIYLKQEHAAALALELILPLLELIRRTSSKQIAQKTANILDKYFSDCKGKTLPTLPQNDAMELLRGIHREALLGPSKLHSKACSKASLLVVRMLLAMDGGNFKEVADAYNDTLKKRHQDPAKKLHWDFIANWINYVAQLDRSKNES